MDALYDVPVKDPDSSLDLLDDYDFAESERFADRRDMDTPPTDVPE